MPPVTSKQQLENVIDTTWNYPESPFTDLGPLILKITLHLLMTGDYPSITPLSDMYYQFANQLEGALAENNHTRVRENIVDLGDYLDGLKQGFLHPASKYTPFIINENSTASHIHGKIDGSGIALVVRRSHVYYDACAPLKDVLVKYLQNRLDELRKFSGHNPDEGHLAWMKSLEELIDEIKFGPITIEADQEKNKVMSYLRAFDDGQDPTKRIKKYVRAQIEARFPNQPNLRPLPPEVTTFSNSADGATAMYAWKDLPADDQKRLPLQG